MPPRFDSLASAYAWLDSHVNYERELSTVVHDEKAFALGRFRLLLERLGGPHRAAPSVHLAGSSGKGSTTLFLETLLRARGERVATFVSPHFREYRERVRIDGAPCPPELFLRSLEEVARVSEALAAEDPDGVPQPDGGERAFRTVFEFLCAAYFVAARSASAERLVVETGLGGRLDATNALEPGPVILTRIDIEHRRLLGDTIEAIAGEKAAILKPGGFAVVNRQAESDATRVFERHAREVGAPLQVLEDDPRIRTAFGPEGIDASFPFAGRTLRARLPVFGPFLVENLQGALAMLERLVPREELAERIETFEDALARMVPEGRLEGRMQPCPGYPRLIVDGGHCPSAAAAVAEAMRAHFPPGTRAAVVVGMASDKEHRAFFEALAGDGSLRRGWDGWTGLVCYPIPSPRATPPESLARAAAGLFPWIRTAGSLTEALEFATGSDEKNEGIVATGSVYGVAGALGWGGIHGAQFTGQEGQALASRDPGDPGA